MNERRFRQTLQEVAEEKVPAVDLWSEIEGQVAPRGPWLRGIQLAGGLAGATLVLVAVLLFASWMASFSQETDQTAAQSEGTVTAAAAATIDAWTGPRLTGSTIYRDDVAPGDTLVISLEWMAPASPLENVHLFLHLVDDDGHLVGQSDVLMETADWPLDRPVGSGHQLQVPSDLALGSYSLQLSLYDRNSEQLIPFVANGNMIEGGLLEIAEINVTATGNYWDGGRWSDEPVYGETNGISRAAHDLFTSCGLVDHDIEQAARRFQASGSAREILEDGRSESFSSRQIIDVVPLAEGVYRVTCLRLREGEPIPPSPQALLANLRLLEHNFSQATLSPTQSLELGVTWYNSLDTRLDVSQFIHLLDEDGSLVVQKDTAVPFDAGAVSQVRFTDTVYLPSTISPGQYQVVIGLYDRTDGERLPFSTDEGRAVPLGRLPLGTIWVEDEHMDGNSTLQPPGS